jgi:hypothetical protein
MTFATPITPATLIGHVDASPQPVAIQDCGWEPAAIARKCHSVFGSWVLPQAAEKCEKLHAARRAVVEYDYRDGKSPAMVALDELCKVSDEECVRALSDDGITVSVSAYNADEDCLTIYRHGKPIAWL